MVDDRSGQDAAKASGGIRREFGERSVRGAVIGHHLVPVDVVGLDEDRVPGVTRLSVRWATRFGERGSRYAGKQRCRHDARDA